MTANGNPSPAIFNFEFINASDRSIRRSNLQCIFNDQEDDIDSRLGAWIIEQYFDKHNTKSFNTHRYFDNNTRTSTGYLFIVNSMGSIGRMRSLIEHSIFTVLVSNNPFHRLMIEKLADEFPDDKFRYIYDVKSSVPDLVNRLFKRQKHFPLLDILETRLKDPMFRKHFVTGMSSKTTGFLAFKNMNKNPDEIEKVFKLGKDLNRRVKEAWAVIEPNLETKTGSLETCGLTIPVIETPKPYLKRGLAKRFLIASNKPVVGVVFGSQGNTHVYLLSSDGGRDMESIGVSFGGTGDHNHCQFKIEDVDVKEFF